MKKSSNNHNRGFTLIELMVVMLIVITASSVTWLSIRYAIDKGNVAEAIAYAKLIGDSAELYLADMGFYPPDVNRGCDPGFVQRLPTKEPGGWDCDETLIAGYHPVGWQDELDDKWLGPYLKEWNTATPWGGKYDYNFWPNGAIRDGECIAPGVYIGIQSDYSYNNGIPPHAEERMIDLGVDDDLAINGEAQLFVQSYESESPVCDPGTPPEVGMTCVDSKTLVCHKAGTPAESNLCVTGASLGAHLGHGDTLGECGS